MSLSGDEVSLTDESRMSGPMLIVSQPGRDRLAAYGRMVRPAGRPEEGGCRVKFDQIGYTNSTFVT